MFNPHEYLMQYRTLEKGAPSLRLLKEAIAAADTAKDTEWQFKFRSYYVHDSMFDSDNLDAMIVFPEMLAIYDMHPEIQEEYQRTLMWDFKNMLGNLADYPQISLAEIEKLLSEFEARCQRYGKSKHTPLYIREKLSTVTHNLLPLSEYGSFANEPGDDLKDCNACEANFSVTCALLRGNREEAEKLSKPLFDRRVSCAEVPELTYSTWIEYLTEHGEYEKARSYAKIMYPMVNGKLEFLNTHGVLLRLYATIDRATGCNIFRRELSNFITSRNQWARLYFAIGAYKLFALMQQPELVLVLPKSFSLYNDGNLYQTEALRDYFYSQAKEIAERLDKRNGNDYFMGLLEREDPPYDEDAQEFVSGYASQQISALGAVCSTLPEELTPNTITTMIESDGTMRIEMVRANEENGSLQFQVTEGNDLFHVMIMVHPTPPLDDFRAVTPIQESVGADAEQAEGMVVCLVPFEDMRPGVALHFQMKFLAKLCPDAVCYLDLTRSKLLDTRWMKMTAGSQVPPIVDYLYNLDLYGDEESETIWLKTEGLRCCSMREIEIFDANRENFPRLCDMLCFITEWMILGNSMPDAGTPFSAFYRADRTPVICTWLPVSQALEYYPEDDPGCTLARKAMLGEDAEALDGNAVLFLYGGENEDGSTNVKRLSTLTEADFENFRYGQFHATANQIIDMAEERYPTLIEVFKKHPDDAYALMFYAKEDDSAKVWIKIAMANEEKIAGVLTEDCLAGPAGQEVVFDASDICDFSVRCDDIIIQPNTAYLAEDL